MQIVRVALYALLSSVGYLMLVFPSIGFLEIQVGLTLLFVIGAAFELRVSEHRFLMMPPALFTAYMFVQSMLAGIWYFAANGADAATQIFVRDESIVRGTWYTMVAVQMLWVAFHSLPSGLLRLRDAVTMKRIPIGFIHALLGISLVCFVASVRLNVFGYVADAANVAYVTYLRFGINLGLLAIVLLAAYDHDDLPRRRLLHLVVIAYFLIGILYGSKSTAVMPVLLMVVALYGAGRRIPLRYVGIGVLSVGLSYAIIEPFRLYYQFAGDTADKGTVTDLVNLYLTAQSSTDREQVQLVASLMERQSYVAVLAKTIEFADETGYHHTEEWRNLLLSPLYGTIPRFIWNSKPLANFGSWASVNIFGFVETTSTGITPQGYAYLVARFGGILLFFGIFGVIQRLIFNAIYLNRAFLPVYLLMFFQVGYPEAPWTFIAGNLQTLILMAPAMYLLARASRTLQTPEREIRAALAQG